MTHAIDAVASPPRSTSGCARPLHWSYAADGRTARAYRSAQRRSSRCVSAALRWPAAMHRVEARSRTSRLIRCSSRRSATSSAWYLNPPTKAMVAVRRIRRAKFGLGSHPTHAAAAPRHGRVGARATTSASHQQLVRERWTWRPGGCIGELHRRAPQHGVPAFLRTIEANVPPTRAVHLVLDDCGTHKTPSVRAWFARSQRFHVHFTPASASWLNLVERFFALLSERQIKPRNSPQHHGISNGRFAPI